MELSTLLSLIYLKMKGGNSRFTCDVLQQILGINWRTERDDLKPTEEHIALRNHILQLMIDTPNTGLKGNYIVTDEGINQFCFRYELDDIFMDVGKYTSLKLEHLLRTIDYIRTNNLNIKTIA